MAWLTAERRFAGSVAGVDRRRALLQTGLHNRVGVLRDGLRVCGDLLHFLQLALGLHARLVRHLRNLMHLRGGLLNLLCLRARTLADLLNGA
jgi:hypothetical protein